ncbi:sigma-E factor regulatory protein RseB domain-containing protein [Actinomycetospora corticicola]|uniref:Outer membrane lipoprotein-sorting protein n=1 Tax=Actinomycetospora corticicola TaxID=663602 RepID=A0A7Y9DVQ4_9PSEU|nr:outer membrane lipoprotein carrier protein LolA [Actinomycetospora corticicola]NYD36296.1 outer membrane lipoprotein-sorting protein [Actinomycetospora corticicola]
MRRRWFGAAGVVAAGAVAAAVIAIPTAAAQPQLPPVSPEDLVASVMTAQPGPFNGTVGIDNELGLPALPGAPQLGNGTQTARIWSGGDGKGRVALPSGDGEKTLVSDGTTRWAYDATDRTATRSTGGAPEQKDPQTDPAGASTQIIGELRKTSQVAVDGTAEVAGRPAYTLVLTPQPTERTMLREVRVAVDAEKRIPLELTVLATGSATPALQIGFDDVTFGPQDPSLFTFTPPPGTTVKDAPAREGRPGPDRQGPPEGTRTVGEGWDRVLVLQRPAGQPGQQGDQQQRPEGAPDLNALGTPVSGPWGNGRAITSAVGTAIVTDDGRVAVGAVPEPVVAEALGTK